MKRVERLAVYVLFMVGSVGAAWAGRMDEAIALYNERKFAEAREIFLHEVSDAGNGAQARYYDAMCLVELGDLTKFRAQAERLRGRYEELTPDQRETLDREFITAAYRARAFEQARTLAGEFPTSYTQSASADRVRMIELLATCEQGLKKSYEAKNWGLGNSAELNELRAKNWANGTRYLRQFLDGKEDLERILAADSSDIATKAQSDLFKSVWRARLILGEEEALLAEIEGVPADVREYFDYLRAWTAFQYFPADLDRAVGLFEAFETAYPESLWRVELRREALKVLFHQGRFLYEHGRSAVSYSLPEIGEPEKEQAGRRLARYRAMVDDGLIKGESGEFELDSGFSAKDLEEIANNYFFSLLLEKKCDELIAKSHAMASNHPRGSKAWAMCRLYEAQARYYRNFPSPEEFPAAAAILDEIIAENVQDDERNAHLPTLVLRWRMILGREMEDPAAIDRAFAKVRDEMPDNRYRDKVLETDEDAEQ